GPQARDARPGEAGRTPKRGPLAPVLELVPGGHGRELEQRAPAARVAVPEVRLVVVPGNLEQILLDPVVEPRPAKNQFSEPIHERFVADEGDPLPVADEVSAERAARLGDMTVRGQFDEVPGLVLFELAGLDQPELDSRRVDSLLEVHLVEAEAVAQE